MGILLPQTLLSADDENALARSVEAGVIAAAVLDGTMAPPSRNQPRPTRTELAVIVEAGGVSRQRLFESNLRLVKVVSIRTAFRTGVSEEDLFQEGCLGLVDAIRRYDHRRGVRFATFALPWIRCRIGEAVAGAAAIRVTAHRIEQYRAERRELAESEARLGRHLGAGERAGGASDWATAAARRALAGMVPLDQAATMELADPVGNDPFAAVESRPVPWPSLLARLPEQQREVVELRFGFSGEARTVVEVAGTLGVSDTTVRRLERRALASLRRWIERLGLEASDLLAAA